MKGDKKTILVIEDEEFLSDIYKTKLEKAGYEVFLARDGEDGYQKARGLQPDLIFLDIVMPELNGYEVLDLLRKDKRTKDLKVCFLSNLSQTEECKKFIGDDVFGYYIKSNLTPNDLAAKAKEIINSESPAKKEEVKKITSEDKEKDMPKPEEKKEQKKQSAKDKRILLIEDKEEIRVMYTIRLSNEGFHIDSADNGIWGVDLAKENKYDIILMDIMLPEMNGYEMLRAIKEDSKNKDTPVILVSNSAQDKEAEKILELGAAKHFVKSRITPSVLAKEIKKILNL